MSDQELLKVPATQLLFARLMRATPSLWTRLGNLETKSIAGELQDVAIHKPIYVTGLARSGTTIVTELLSRHSAVTTHHYSDFPLVWTPYWWNTLRARLPLPDSHPNERAHQDRIKITPDSPEAVEEVIWMRFFSKAHDPSVSQVLDANTENPEFETFYRDHIRKLLLARGANRYLAKGNYNLTRLAYLLKLFPDARFVIMVRDPVWHIASLMKQDRLFRELDQRDTRFTDYLKLLGHFEFGAHKVPINIGDTALGDEIAHEWRKGEAVRGWALYWHNIYAFAGQQLQSNRELAKACLVVKYEALCAEPAKWLARIVDHCRLESESFQPALNDLAETVSKPDYYRPEFTARKRSEIRALTRDTGGQFDYSSSNLDQ